MSQGAGRVPGRHLAVERREAWVVAVGRYTETVGGGVRRNVGRLEGLGEDLKWSLEPLGLVGWQCHNL